MKFLRSLHIRPNLYIYLSSIALLFVISYPFNFLFPLAQGLLCLLAVFVLTDIIILFRKSIIFKVSRTVNSQLSLSDENIVKLNVSGNFGSSVYLKIIDELPYQLQIRDLEINTTLQLNEEKILIYKIKPLKRGIYEFFNINIFASSALGLIERKFVIKANQKVPVYPSVVQMRKYELQVFSKMSLTQGIKKIRRIGHNNEFEQIKQYVQGDDFRTINWKATSRTNELMVNQYEDEKAQQIYCVIDKSRNMRMPFDGMSLLDYAINSSLVMSNIALNKSDKAGIITYADKLGGRLSAERSSGQLRKILELLYRQKTEFLEANFELLYYGVRNFVKGRSLLLLYTNFESMYSLQRALPLLRRINQMHLLVVIFFENTELNETAQMECENVSDIYFKTLAEKSILEKKLIAQELRKLGIQTILTTPDNLSVDSINKYLELKSRGMI